MKIKIIIMLFLVLLMGCNSKNSENFLNIKNGITTLEELVEQIEFDKSLKKMYSDEIFLIKDDNFVDIDLKDFSLEEELYDSKKEILKDGKYKIVERSLEEDYNSKIRRIVKIKNGKVEKFYFIRIYHDKSLEFYYHSTENLKEDITEYKYDENEKKYIENIVPKGTKVKILKEYIIRNNKLCNIAKNIKLYSDKEYININGKGPITIFSDMSKKESSEELRELKSQLYEYLLKKFNDVDSSIMRKIKNIDKIIECKTEGSLYYLTIFDKNNKNYIKIIVPNVFFVKTNLRNPVLNFLNYKCEYYLYKDNKLIESKIFRI